MKPIRRVLAFTVTLALVLLSPGMSAWAQVARISNPGSSASGVNAAAGAASLSGAAAVPTVAPVTALSLSPALSAPSASIAAPAAPAAFAPAAALHAAAALPAASVPAAAAPAAAQAAAASAASRAPPAQALSAAPAASAMEGVRRELPEFSKMAAGDSKDAASQDFLSRVGELFRRPAPALGTVAAPASGMSRSFLSKSSGKQGARQQPREDVDDLGNPKQDDGGLDGLGNPTRRGDDHGPDSTSDGDSRGGDNSGLFGTIGLAAGVTALSGAGLLGSLITLPLVMISLILHEIGHGKAAKFFGDPTATLQGRASFNPANWWKHVDPMMTIVLPLLTYFTSGFLFGGAKPVPVDQRYFKHPTRDMAWVAFAGPAVNIALAALGSLAFAAATGAGMGTLVLGALSGFVFINVLLAVFNLIPVLPLDGGHILLAALPHRAAETVRGFYARIGMLGFLPIMVIAFAGGGLIMAATAAVTHLLLGLSFAVTGVQLAGGLLPAVAALGMALGSVKTPAVARLAAGAQAPPSGPAVPGAAGGSHDQPVDYVVVFSGDKALTKDLHLSAVDANAANYVQAYQGMQSGLLSQLDGVGLSAEQLASYNASPIASYRRINAATIRVDAAKAAEFKKELEARGHKVYLNERRKIIIPSPIIPEDADPSVRNAVTMAENLKITKADAVQAIVEKKYGKPDLNPWQRLKRLLGAAEAPQPLVGVVDSGADTTHPLLRRVKEVKNYTSGENVDDIGHGSWVTSMVLNYAPWLKNVVHYKTFVGGSATTDDILKSLTAAANDGNLVISNSWGDDEGDPKGPDSLLVQKLASEGHIMVFAAGNAGPGKNTVGSPAIVTYKDAKTGASRVIAVAATDRAKKTAFFSSRGPASPKTKGQAGVPHRPDLSAIGYNTEGAWPASLGDADRTDAKDGAIKAISGTSMSTPSVAGAIALLLVAFGVTGMGDKLDAVVNAVFATLEKTGKNDYDSEGEGFINIEAAYELLYKQFNPGTTPPTAVLRYQRLRADEKLITDYLDPTSEANRVAGYPEQRIVDSMLGDLKQIHDAKAELETSYPDIAHRSSGLLSRAWARLTGRAPVAAHVLEYRRLVKAVAQDDAERRAYLSSIQKLGSTGVREEMLEQFENGIEPRYDANRKALEALTAAYPNVEYESAGTLARAWLKITGRAPSY